MSVAPLPVPAIGLATLGGPAPPDIHRVAHSPPRNHFSSSNERSTLDFAATVQDMIRLVFGRARKLLLLERLRTGALKIHA